MNPLSLSVRKALFRGYYLGTGRSAVLRDRDRFDALYFQPSASIDAHAQEQLASLLSSAAQNVPYYRDLLRGREITAATAPAVLASLPILTKKLIRAEGQRLLSEKPGQRTRINTSGGSTGEPIRLVQDLEMSRLSRSFELMFMRWTGHEPGEPHVLVWGVPNESIDEHIPAHERMFRFVHNETYLNCYRVTEELLDQWIDRINAIRPTLIEGYVDAIHELSRRVIKTGKRIHQPRGIITSAGVLTAEIKSTVKQAFNCRIVNRYGSREVSNLACSCGQCDSLHVNQAMAWIEIVDEQGQPCAPGQEGDILVSLFTNHTMPMIRYRIEDRAIWDDTRNCPCGRQTLRLRSIAGRRTDYLLGRNGVKISGIALTTLLYPVIGIRQYQYRQTSLDEVTLAAVPQAGVSEETLRREITPLLAKLEGLMQGTPVKLKFESEIVPSKSGKYRYVLNELDPSSVGTR